MKTAKTSSSRTTDRKIISQAYEVGKEQQEPTLCKQKLNFSVLYCFFVDEKICQLVSYCFIEFSQSQSAKTSPHPSFDLEKAFLSNKIWLFFLVNQVKIISTKIQFNVYVNFWYLSTTRSFYQQSTRYSCKTKKKAEYQNEVKI